jgi:putative ATP-dependent endonuclease of the OLD family
LAIAQLLKIPTFVMFDADGDEKNESYRARHKTDNEQLLKLLGGNPADCFPGVPVFQPSYIIWDATIGDKVRADYVPDDWTKWKAAAEAEFGSVGGLNKNALFIASLLERAWADKKPSKTLIDTCEALIKFAKS